MTVATILISLMFAGLCLLISAFTSSVTTKVFMFALTLVIVVGGFKLSDNNKLETLKDRCDASEIVTAYPTKSGATSPYSSQSGAKFDFSFGSGKQFCGKTEAIRAGYDPA